MELIHKVTRDAFHVVKKYTNVCSEVNKIHLFISLLWDLWRKGTSSKVELVSRLEHSESKFVFHLLFSWIVLHQF